MTKANQQSITRRTVVAGALATIPATAIPVVAISCEPDPIFAAIDAHRAAFEAWMPPLKITSCMSMNDPAYEPAEETTAHYCGIEEEAATELTNIVPTSMAGVLALLAHIDAFNRGYCGRYTGESEHHNWPVDLGDTDVLRHNGKPLEMPFAFWIMRNIETALRNLTGAA